MFGSSRRHRPPNPPLNSATANPNATMAAASAFMSAANEKNNRTLSSAAAAAALRARPQTPTNVGEVQTKRMMRRSASVSSTASAGAAAASRSNHRLERRGSSGSMTERTFRSPSPSPHRASASHIREPRPPVPQLPTNHRRAASSTTGGGGGGGVGMQNFRTASQKMKTEQPSYYTQPAGDPRNVRTSDAPMRMKSPPTRSESYISSPQRPDSRSSVNFSYPTAFRAQSPPASPTSTQAQSFGSPTPRTPPSPHTSSRGSLSSLTNVRDQKLVFDPNSRRMVPKVAADTPESYDKGEADRQPRRKKDTGIRRDGSQRKKGAVARIKGTMIDADAKERDLPKREQPLVETAPTREESQVLEEEPATKAIITTEDKGKQKQEEDEDIQPPLQLQISDTRSPPPLQQIEPEANISYPTSQTLGKRPSTVQEEPEEVKDEDDVKARPSQKVLNTLDAVPTRQAIFEQSQPSQSSNQNKDSGMVEQSSTEPRLPEQDQSPAESAKERSPLFVENKPVVDLSRESSSVRRSNSNSPARQARFATTTSTTSDNLTVRHTPLPRSASPIKSALKRTSSPARELSPSDNSSDLSRSRGTSPNQREEPAVPRKKSVRVSFDDRTMAMVVGESAPIEDTDSHDPPSPQQLKRPWYKDIGRSKKKDFTLEDDEIMKPRPALPSFGSIREKKAREIEERPLVRPHEPSHSPAPSSPELRASSPSAPSDAEAPDELSLGQSTDQAIGLTLAKEQKLRNEANISRFREPLPPVVTSIEGSGYVSDSIRSSDSDDDLISSIADTSDAEAIPSTQTTQLESHDNSQNGSTDLEHKPSIKIEDTPNSIELPPKDIPEIAIIQPSPMLPEQHLRQESLSIPPYYDVPGGFPDEEHDVTHDTQSTSKKDAPDATNATSTADAIFEPMAQVHPVQPGNLPQTTLATTAPVNAGDDDSTDESESSIYSDAYEDLSDVDGEGFMSIDAVVESPVIDKIATSQPHEPPRDTSKQTNSEESAQQATKRLIVAAQSPEPPRDENDWEIAKNFWRSLTAEKRLQLEQEAWEEAGAEGDREEVALPVRRVSNRKKNAQHKQPEAESPTQPSTLPSTSAPPIAIPDRKYTVHSDREDKDESVSPGSKSPQLRTTLRGDQPSPSSGMRKTMRTNAGAGQASQSSSGHATTQRDKTTRMSSKATQRQSSDISTLPITASGNAMSKSKPTLERRVSDASDSSFKRSRAIPSRGLGFRNTMRPSSNRNSVDVTKASKRFSLRSLSPSGSSFRGNSNVTGSPPVTMMRRTLRSNSESSQEGRRSSLHFPSLGRMSKSPSAKHAKRSSRFGDSSDEDDGGGDVPGFRSRFDDSSDEESIRPGTSSRNNPLGRGTLRASAPPSGAVRRSTPVPEVAEDSPDPPDSDDEMPSPLQSPPGRASMAARNGGMARSNSEALGTSLGTSTLTRSRSGHGGIITSASTPAMSTQDKRRTSLFGILRRNKRADQAGKIQRPERTESAARRDTKLERNTGTLKDIRGDRPTSPKLQKKSSAKASGSSWPLPENQGRSSSVGNVMPRRDSNAGADNNNNKNPSLSSRRSTSLAVSSPTYHEDDTATVDRKKKKFGALRRMFRLDD
ncbi:hypothetical protein F5B20DRAFT_98197 [Whalleya microplaca]|nr:hypothetical protein F5B20DRAFT_98197 [Whalleya microplaca]